MKKFIKPYLVASVASFTFAACSGDSGSSSGNTGDTKEETKQENTETESLGTLEQLKKIANMNITDADALLIKRVDVSKIALTPSHSVLDTESIANQGMDSRLRGNNERVVAVTPPSNMQDKLFKMVGADTQEVVYANKDGKTIEFSLNAKKIQSLESGKFALVHYGTDDDRNNDYPIVTRKSDGKAWLLPKGHGAKAKLTQAGTNSYVYIHQGRLAKLTLDDADAAKASFLTTDLKLRGVRGDFKEKLPRFKNVTVTQEYLISDSGKIKKHKGKFSCLHKSGMNASSEGFLCGRLVERNEAQKQQKASVIEVKFDSNLEMASTTTVYSFPSGFSAGHDHQGLVSNITKIGNKIITWTNGVLGEFYISEIKPTPRIVFEASFQASIKGVHRGFDYGFGEYSNHKGVVFSGLSLFFVSKDKTKLYKIDLTKDTYTAQVFYDFSVKYSSLHNYNNQKFVTFGFKNNTFFFKAFLKTGVLEDAYIDLTQSTGVAKTVASRGIESIQITPLN